MSARQKVAIVIPAFNEAASIAAVVKSLSEYGTVIVVDDGSGDDTAKLARNAGAKVILHGNNRGYDAALASGFAEAENLGAEAIVTFDADGQIKASGLPAVLEAIEMGPSELVIGVRHNGAARFAEALFNLYTRLRFKVPDILCGLKGFRMQAYARHRDSTAGNSINTALALSLLREGAAFTTTPVEIVPREGHSRFGGRWSANVRILRALAGALREDILWR